MPSSTQHIDEMFRLASLTPGELGKVTGMAGGQPADGIETRVTPVSYDWASPATAGLWRVDVQAGQRQDVTSRSYFVKLLRHPRLWPQLGQIPAAMQQEFANFLPWQFELDIYESGIGRVPPPGMRTRSCTMSSTSMPTTSRCGGSS